MSASALVFAVIAATFYAGHQVADHVFGQTDHWACHKVDPGWRGWRYIAAHVLAYHLVLAAMVAVAVVLLHLPTTIVGVTSGLGFSALTHALLDRRWPVRWLLEHTGSRPFSRLAGHGLNGMYLADQALHYGCLWIAALIVACL